MADSNSLINVGDLSKPANTLIEKISEAVGGIYRPWQIRRIAQAEADADRIRTVSQIEISDLQSRALRRFLVEEAKKQNNIEVITQKALPEVTEQAQPQNVQDDWITNFFDKCRLISDEQMQSLWARVLAGEANAPGKFSKRTVNLLAGLDKAEAEMFAKLCSFTFVIDGLIVPLIYDHDHKIYTDHSVDFDCLSHLDSIGLIHFNTLTGYSMTNISFKSGFVHYHEYAVWLALPEDANKIKLGVVILTNAGQQLASLCKSEPCSGFIDFVRDHWKKLGYSIDQNAAAADTKLSSPHPLTPPSTSAASPSAPSSQPGI